MSVSYRNLAGSLGQYVLHYFSCHVGEAISSSQVFKVELLMIEAHQVQLNFKHLGRRYRLTDVAGKVVTGILA